MRAARSRPAIRERHMPRVTDRQRILRSLRSDPVWAVYAIGDLEEPWFSASRWYEPDIALIFRGFDQGVLFAMGPRSVREAVEGEQRPLYLQLKDSALQEAERCGFVADRKAMLRMSWTRRDRPMPLVQNASRLARKDAALLNALYQDGRATGEAPDFFYASMLAEGPFYGVFERGELVSVAGTHLHSVEQSVAAIGNVYTRRDRRGHGYARQAMSAVLLALNGVETVALNVRQDNATAIRMYESLGFTHYCEYFEGLLL
jgi:ribosomal protein S18 acetylase RimI-like enzyme